MALRKQDAEVANQVVKDKMMEQEIKKTDTKLSEKEEALLSSPKYMEKYEPLLKELLGDEFSEDIYDPIKFSLIYLPKITELLKSQDKMSNFIDGYTSIKQEAEAELSINDEEYFNDKFKNTKVKLFKQDIGDPPKRLRDSQERRKALYHMDIYSPEELQEMADIILATSIPMGGLIKSHKEVSRKKGWLRPFLIGYETLLWGRWRYWLDILDKGTLEGSGPIPQIDWHPKDESVHQVHKMLNSCIDGVYNQGASIEDFADWLLWGLGIGEAPARVSTRVNKHWYEAFDLALVLMYPTDYLSQLLAEQSSRGDSKHRGYFPTPMDVCFAMTEIAFTGLDPEEAKYKTVDDPCVGCGAMLLPASNHSLFGYGQDISSVSVKFTKVQMMWYAPWYAVNPFTPPK